MTTYLLAVGINHYTDRAFRALSCCENDATELHSLFKRNLELGDRARKLIGAVSIADVKNELRKIGQEIRNGDTFVFFFAGHGYQHPRREDQFLLFPEAEARLVNKGFLDGMLSLSALCELTSDWSGVSRVFILDACRSWLPGRGSEGAQFDNEKALAYISSRDPAFGQSLAKPPDNEPSQGGAFPPIILNATRNGQEARELEDHQRGVLALALEQALESQQQSGQIIYIGDRLIADIGKRMNVLLQQGRLGVEQTPFLTPPSAQVLLFKPSRIPEQKPQNPVQPGTIHTSPSTKQICTHDEVLQPPKKKSPGGMYIAGVAVMLAAIVGGVTSWQSAPTPSISKELKPGTIVKDCDICPEMVAIPAGKFQMGTTSAGASPSESPAHTVDISRQFFIGKTEITAAQYNECVKDKQCAPILMDRGEDLGSGVAMPYGPAHPMVINERNRITERTSSYLIWLSNKTGKGYRLPSASEWEYAARAGKTTDYYWGTSDDRICDYENVRDLSSTPYNRTSMANDGNIANCSDGYPGTAPVASRKPNPWGLYDMLGNVAEVVADCWSENVADYPSNGAPLLASQQSGYSDPTCNNNRVIKGGGYAYGYSPKKHAVWLQKRGGNYREYIYDLGFRVARDP